ncbi:ABC transporter substrate-binding protein [Paenibacillus hodogayensis]|uniref:ABC transporter substrate-binding protein n=1 Tax=Paenibacillus hodogayensis TaxID=279208 RepID=A0ABV5W340_9BACL
MVQMKRSILSVGLVALLLAGCGETGSDRGGGVPNDTDSKPKDPITLYMLQDVATISDEEFANFIAAPVKAKYPHITVELVRNTKSDAGLSEMITAGSFPDFMLMTMYQIKVHRDLGTAEDLTPYLQKAGIRLDRFDPSALQTSRVFGESENLYALPFSLNFLATFYNKDLFDRFGVPYPKAGMTWQDIITLGTRFARSENGVQYKALFTSSMGEIATQLTLPRVDPVTNKSLFLTDGWKKVAEVIQGIHSIPGNKGATLDDFLKTQTLPLVASYDARFAALEKLHGTPEQFNWDVTQFPSFPERPNTSFQSTGHFLGISRLSKHKEEVLQVIQLLTDDSIQTKITENGRFTALSSEAIKNKYGANMKSMKGKNIEAVFKSAFAPPYQPTTYDGLTNVPLNNAAKSIMDGTLDINTALRQAEEASNRAIEAEIQMKKNK